MVFNNARFNKLFICCFMVIALTSIFIILFGSTDNNVADAADLQPKDTAIYFIKNKATGYYMDFNGSDDYSGARLIQWTKNYDINQRFLLKKVNNTEWNIFGDKSKRSVCVDVSGASSNVGAQLIRWEYSNDSNQRYKFVSNNDGSFKILTGASNYTKCIGIQQNSRRPGEFCIQTETHNDTTSWILEEIWGFSYNSDYIPLNQNYPTPKNSDKYGTPTLVDEEIITASRMSAKSIFGTIKDEPCNMFLYRYWKYSVPINVQIYDFGKNIGLNSNQTYTYTITQSQSTTQTKKESIEIGLESTIGGSVGEKLNIGAFTESANINAIFTLGVTGRFEYSQSNTFSVEEKQEFHIETPKTAELHSYNYKLETRATISLYYVQVFRFDDERSETKDGIWTKYKYTPKGSLCWDEQFYWDIEETFVGFNPYELDPNTGKYVYCGDKEQGVIYA